MECRFCLHAEKSVEAEYLAPKSDLDYPIFGGDDTLVYIPVCEVHMQEWYLMTPPSGRLPFVALADDRDGVLHTWDRLKFDEVYEWTESGDRVWTEEDSGEDTRDVGKQD